MSSRAKRIPNLLNKNSGANAFYNEVEVLHVVETTWKLYMSHPFRDSDIWLTCLMFQWHVNHFDKNSVLLFLVPYDQLHLRSKCCPTMLSEIELMADFFIDPCARRTMNLRTEWFRWCWWTCSSIVARERPQSTGDTSSIHKLNILASTLFQIVDKNSGAGSISYHLRVHREILHPIPVRVGEVRLLQHNFFRRELWYSFVKVNTLRPQSRSADD